MTDGSNRGNEGIKSKEEEAHVKKKRRRRGEIDNSEGLKHSLAWLGLRTLLYQIH